jgi:hypothetical protein
MIDRIYWIWQVLHPFSAGDIAGTITFNNKPAQPWCTEDILAGPWNPRAQPADLAASRHSRWKPALLRALVVISCVEGSANNEQIARQC